MTQLGALTWSPGADNSLEPFFSTSNPEAVTHTLRMTAGVRQVHLGFNRRGGGYMWSNKLYGFEDIDEGQQCGATGYGRGMLGSLRSKLHNGMHNPIQSGRFYNIGGRTRVIESKGAVIVPQFRAPLWDDQEFHFINHRSEFDFSCKTDDASVRYGIPAFEHQEYFVWAHPPEAIKEFQSGVMHSGPYEGRSILDRTAIVQDISQHPGIQRPTEMDYSLVVQTIKGLRPPTKFKYLHYRFGNEWVSKEYGTGEDMGSKAAVSLGRAYLLDSGEPIRLGRASMDLPLYILSTRPTLHDGTAIGLLVPDDLMNTKQVKVLNTATGAIAFEEDRRITFNFAVSKTVDSSWKGNAFNVMLARCTLSGLLNPLSATATYGFPACEAITNKTVVLYGTPEEIFEGVKLNG